MTDTPTFPDPEIEAGFIKDLEQAYCNGDRSTFNAAYAQTAHTAYEGDGRIPPRLDAAIALLARLRGGPVDAQMRADWAQVQADCARASGAQAVYENTALSGELRDHALDEYCETVDAMHADLVAMFARVSGGAA